MSRDNRSDEEPTAGDYGPAMSRSFREALLRVLNERSISLKSVAEGAGVSYEQLKVLRRREGASTNVDDARRVANYLGLTLDELLEDDLAEVRSEVVALYNELTEREIAVLRAAAQALPGRGSPPED
jgi:transcriptional regulator with XRE-family HTH domain